MSLREREGLIARIRQIRRTDPTPANPTGASPTPPGDKLQELQTRVAHLEQLVEGLQDSVHRESERQSRAIAELEAQIHPSVMSAALSKDARERGL
jgi:hypothetical protein